MSILRFGTCSWKFPSWAGLVYSQADGIDYLASVDDDFRFTIKAPNSVTLTHFSGRAGQKGTGPNPYFLSAVVMLQFEYLNRQKMSGLEDFCEKIDAFLTALRDRVDPWPIAIELRNPNFLKPAYFDLLAAGSTST